jgi:serine/threonine protein phosphatase PrpC
VLDDEGRSGSLFTANVGDARAVLCHDGEGVRLSRDFKPFDPDEYERVVQLGGYVSLRDGGRQAGSHVRPTAHAHSSH